MPMTSITYSRKFQVGQYEPEEFVMVYEVDSNENPEAVMEYLKKMANVHRTPLKQGAPK